MWLSEVFPLKGKLDKLEFDGKQVNVVDYKTGNPDNAMQKQRALRKITQWQAITGARLFSINYWWTGAQRDWQVISTEFDFIEPDNKKLQKTKSLYHSGR